MKLSSNALTILNKIDDKKTKLGDLREMAKVIKKNHPLALELWASGRFLARQLAILILDKKALTQQFIDQLTEDINVHSQDERNQLMDWLMANQLAKDKQATTLMESWRHSVFNLQRRIFWYHQARQRWVGQIPPPNTEYLLTEIEKHITSEAPEVQWAMNFTAAQIGIFEPKYRARCIALGERTGLFKDEVVSRNCTPNYLPAFIAIQVAKLKIKDV